MMAFISNLLFFSFLLTHAHANQRKEFINERDYNSGLLMTDIDSNDVKRVVKAKHNISSALRQVQAVKGDIKKAARAFGIDPIHIAGAILGEHALNVDYRDTLQDPVIKAWLQTQSSLDQSLFEMIHTPAFDKCRSKRSDYDYWYCVTREWHRNYGKGLAFGSATFYKKFTNTFFNPNRTGFSFGLGQMSPLRILMLDDMVKSVNPSLAVNFYQTGDIRKTFENILNPNKVVYYIAANIRFAIDAYKQIAKFDISTNPGVTATLYNIGQEKINAKEKYDSNISAIRNREKIDYPRPNDLGRWVIQNLDVISSSIR